LGSLGLRLLVHGTPPPLLRVLLLMLWGLGLRLKLLLLLQERRENGEGRPARLDAALTSPAAAPCASASRLGLASGAEHCRGEGEGHREEDGDADGAADDHREVVAHKAIKLVQAVRATVAVQPVHDALASVFPGRVPGKSRCFTPHGAACRARRCGGGVEDKEKGDKDQVYPQRASRENDRSNKTREREKKRERQQRQKADRERLGNGIKQQS
jgi:hypothetical protein